MNSIYESNKVSYKTTLDLSYLDSNHSIQTVPKELELCFSTENGWFIHNLSNCKYLNSGVLQSGSAKNQVYDFFESFEEVAKRVVELVKQVYPAVCSQQLAVLIEQP